MKVGFYHSLIDWHHPQYIMDDRNGPYRTDPARQQMNEGRDQEKYAQYLYEQTRELLTEFGRVDVLWYDFSFPDPQNRGPAFGKGKDDWRSEKLLKMVRELQPHVVLNDRLNLVEGWDVKTPEQTQPCQWVTVGGKQVVWEACQTLSGSWGYHRDEQSWRSVDELIRTLIDCVSKGGNLLLNVGPTGRGEFDRRALNRLTGIGEWMKRHSRSIYGCTQAPAEFKPPLDGRLTYNPDTRRLYVHVFAWPYKHLHLDGLAGKVEYAQLLNDASEVPLNVDEWHATRMETGESTLTLTLPQQKPDVAIPVIELFLK
jgi:alpha-L-fucosidase